MIKGSLYNRPDSCIHSWCISTTCKNSYFLHSASSLNSRSSIIAFSSVNSPIVRNLRKRCSSNSSSDNPDNSSSASLRSEEHTSELQSRPHLVCRLLLEKKN